jgi:hypothetical protein
MRKLHSYYLSRQSGTALIFGIFSLLIGLAFAGFSIDVGYMMVIRNQLQNAADAAALNGANYLVNLGDIKPVDFSKAEQAARDAFSSTEENPRPLNTANNIPLAIRAAQVKTGCWDMSGNDVGIQTICSSGYVPAIGVTVEMNNEINGQIGTFFSRIVGFDSYSMRAKAVAVARPSPDCIDTGMLLPFAMNECAFNRYWDSANNSPSIVPTGVTRLPGYPYVLNGNQTITGPNQISEQPWIFWLTSSYHAYTETLSNGTVSQCEGGQWTSLNTTTTNSNAESVISGLIANIGNTTGNSVCATGGSSGASQIWISTGTMSSPYQGNSGNNNGNNGNNNGNNGKQTD